MPEGGTVIIYVDNQSVGKDVYFDNIMIEHYTGRVEEETHYYPYGLALNTNMAMNALKTEHKFNGIPLVKDLGLELNNALFRDMDSQTGRFWQLDPKLAYQLSPYSAMSNNPALLSDPLGDTTHIYGKNGVLIGIVNDHLKNQIHFLSIDGKKDATPWVISDEKGVVADKWGAKFREISTAFLGENSAKSLKSIAMESAKIDDGGINSGKEKAFYAEVSETREIIFKELPVPNEIKSKAKDDYYPFVEATDYYNKHVGNMNNLYGVDHTHTRGWFRTSFGAVPYSEVSQDISLQNYGTPSGSPGNTDYSMGGLRDMPRFIGSPVGVAIYNANKLYDFKKNVYSYGFFKR